MVIDYIKPIERVGIDLTKVPITKEMEVIIYALFLMIQIYLCLILITN